MHFRALRGSASCALALAAALFHAAAGAYTTDLRGNGAVEGRAFFESPKDEAQISASLAVKLDAELRLTSADRVQTLTVAPFLRSGVHGSDTTADLREFNWLYAGKDWYGRVGMLRVFWGAVESRHLVDIVNQADLIEDYAGDFKLGQPGAVLGLNREWGALEALALPGFRTRRLPGEANRPRYVGLPVNVDAARYPEGKPAAWALRGGRSLGDLDFHVHYFRGIDREPGFAPDITAGGVVLTPTYTPVRQLGLDFQYALQGWLWKGELMHRGGYSAPIRAGVLGLEYTIYRLGGGEGDLGLLLEHIRDERPADAPLPLFEQATYAGIRYAANDHAGTELVAGVTAEHRSGAKVLRLRYDRRFARDLGVHVEYHGFYTTRDLPALESFARDSYLLIALRRFF